MKSSIIDKTETNKKHLKSIVSCTLELFSQWLISLILALYQLQTLDSALFVVILLEYYVIKPRTNLLCK